MAEKLLLAVSGGPDSMFLLDKYKNKNIVVVHINYQKRPDSDVDQKIVENFCQKNNILCEIYMVEEKASNNFQNWARELRYNFFHKMYIKHQCNKLLIAHHKDDFVETGLMQVQKNKITNFYGIKKNTTYKNMHIYRPFIYKYWKKDIEKYLNKKQIAFAIDSSNAQDIYERNKIRKFLSTSPIKKRFWFWWFRFKNVLIAFRQQKINRQYNFWKQNNFTKNAFKVLDNPNEVIYLWLTSNLEKVNITKNKIENINQFIKSDKNNNCFIINDDVKILKENSIIKLIKRN